MTGDGSARVEAIDCGAVQLKCVVAGPSDGELIVLLHGFPEHRDSWQPYIEPLVGAGYRVIVPNQRGYGDSDKPKGVAAYGLAKLCDDVEALIASQGKEIAHVVGHDWGGVVTWWMAHDRPHCVLTATIMNVPHLWAMKQKVLFGSLRQMARSWYVAVFQLPAVPEAMLARGDFAALVGAMVDTSVPGTFSDADVAALKSSWAAPGALTAMLNWYRAALWQEPPKPAAATVACPLLLIWGEQDHALGTDLIEPSMALAPNGKVHRFADASHWVNHEKVDEILPLMLAHLQTAS